jgi:chromosome segregation ATPase
MKTNQTPKIICLCSALGFAVPVGFGQTETNNIDEPSTPKPPAKEQQVEPTPSKEEEAKSPEPQVVWNGEVLIEEQNKLIRKNQNNLIKSLDGIVTEIQKSNQKLEQSIQEINQQQASLTAQLMEFSKRLDETIKGVQTNADQATAILKTSFEAKVEQLSSQIDTNQEKVKTFQVEHSGSLSKLTDSTGLANEGVNENKTLLGKIQSENSQIQQKISSLENEVIGLETKAKENHEKVEGALGSISSKLALSFVLKTIVILAALGLGFYVWKNKRMIREDSI